MRCFVLKALSPAICFAAASCADPAGVAGVGSFATAQSADSADAQDYRLVEENGVTYRVDPDGTRVQLDESAVRVVLENGVRYKVYPGGERVRVEIDAVGVAAPPGVSLAEPEVVDEPDEPKTTTSSSRGS